MALILDDQIPIKNEAYQIKEYAFPASSLLKVALLINFIALVVVVWNYTVTTTVIETITTLIVGLFLSLLFLALTAYYAFRKLSWTTLVVLQPHKIIVIKDTQKLQHPSNWWRLVDKGDKFVLQPRSFFLRYRWTNVVVANKKDVKPSYEAFVNDLSGQGIQIL